MSRPFKSYLLIFLLLMSMSGCIKENDLQSESAVDQNEIDGIIEENASLKKENERYKEQYKLLRNKFDQLSSVAAYYIGYGEPYRLITGTIKHGYWMPSSISPVTCSISSGELVKVLLAAEVDGELWLFVNVPAPDAFTVFGWIRESETEKYTKENQSLVTAYVYIKEGTIGEKLNGEKIKTEGLSPGYIEKRKGEKVLIFFGGGEEIWYRQSDVVYPDPEGEMAGFLGPWVK